MKRLMLVEDHLAFRQSLACVLKHESGIEVVGQAGSLAEGRDGAAKGANIALIDLDLPDGDGVELIRELSEASTPVAVVALITRYDPARHNQTLRAGAQQVL